jgi:glycerol kinase
VVETTALGAAYLAGLAVGYWDNVEQIADNWEVERTYRPQMPAAHSQQLYQGWQEAVRRARGWAMDQEG